MRHTGPGCIDVDRKAVENGSKHLRIHNRGGTRSPKYCSLRFSVSVDLDSKDFWAGAEN